MEKVDSEFKAFLPSIAPKTELFGKLGEMIIKSAEQRDTVLKSKRSRAHCTLDRLDQELKELIRLRTQNLITDEEFQAHRSMLLEQRHATEVVPKQNSFKPDEIRSRLDEITQPLHELLDTWSVLPPTPQSRFQRLILPVGFAAGTIRTAELGLLFRTIGDFSDHESTLVHLRGKRWNHICQEIMDFSDFFRSYHESEDASREPV